MKKESLEKPVVINGNQMITKKLIVDNLNKLKEDKPGVMPFLKS